MGREGIGVMDRETTPFSLVSLDSDSGIEYRDAPKPLARRTHF